MIARLVRPALLLAATAALSACTAYDGYGSSRVSVGYSSGYPYGYSPYSYYGWYDGFYYPGNGYYIYDSFGARHRWSDRHRNYWEGRRGGRRGGDNWDGYRRDRDGRYHDGNRGGERGDYSRDRRDNDRGDRGNWQRRGDGDNRGDRGNWQRRGDGRDQSRGDGRRGDRSDYSRGRRDDSASSARSTPQVSRPRTEPSTERSRPVVREGRDGRITVDRGREFRRGSPD